MSDEQNPEQSEKPDDDDQPFELRAPGGFLRIPMRRLDGAEYVKYLYIATALSMVILGIGAAVAMVLWARK